MLIEQFDLECEFNDDGTEIKVAELESRLRCEFPDDYRRFLATTNGESPSSDGLCGGYRFLASDEVEEIADEWRAHLDEQAWQGKTASSWFLGLTRIYEPTWIPIAGLSSRELVLLNVGNHGQGRYEIFQWSAESGPAELLANGLVQFLGRIVNELIDDDGYIKDLLDLEPVFPPG